jgi:hypothetical protein
VWKSKPIDTVENGNVQNQVQIQILLRGLGNGIDQQLTQDSALNFVCLGGFAKVQPIEAQEVYGKLQPLLIV